ncbi:MAG: stage III sporulation protein AG [Bacillota bacterium]
MKIIEKIKQMILNRNYKQTIYNLTAIIIICVIVLLSWDTLFGGNLMKDISNATEKTDGAKSESKNEQIQNTQYKDTVEVQLKSILHEIKGVGEVEVMVTYESSSEVIPASNMTRSNQITEEKDAQGGSRTTTQEETTQNIVTVSGDDKELIILKEIKPQIKGVVVVAEGAGNIEVKNALVEAVKTIFQIPAHKVMVYEKK